MSAPAPKKPSRLTSICGFLFMMGVIASILFLNNPPITAEAVNKRLQGFADALAKDAARASKKAALSSGAVAVEGVGYDRYVVIPDVHFLLDGSWALDTSKTTVILDPLNDKRMIFKFDGPITVTGKNQQKMALKMPSPLKFGYFEDATSGSLITLRLPPEFAFSGEQAVEMSYDGVPEISVKYNAATKESEASSEFRNVIIQSGDEYNIGALAFNLKEKEAVDHKQEGLLTFTVSDLIRRGADGKAMATCSLSANIGYGSNESLMDVFGIPDKAAAAASIHKLVIACDDFTIKMDGAFAFQPGDSLPSGAVSMTIDNPKAFLASPFMPESTRSELALALPKITGHPVDGEKISIPLKRDPNGAFMLGAVASQQAGITLINQFFK